MKNLSVSFYSLHQACHIHKTLFLILVEKFFLLFYCIWVLVGPENHGHMGKKSSKSPSPTHRSGYQKLEVKLYLVCR